MKFEGKMVLECKIIHIYTRHLVLGLVRYTIYDKCNVIRFSQLTLY